MEGGGERRHYSVYGRMQKSGKMGGKTSQADAALAGFGAGGFASPPSTFFGDAAGSSLLVAPSSRPVVSCRAASPSRMPAIALAAEGSRVAGVEEGVPARVGVGAWAPAYSGGAVAAAAGSLARVVNGSRDEMALTEAKVGAAFAVKAVALTRRGVATGADWIAGPTVGATLLKVVSS